MKLTIIFLLLSGALILAGWLCEYFPEIKYLIFYIVFIPFVVGLAIIGFLLANNEINKPRENRRRKY